MDNTKEQEISMTIIANAGEARGLAFEALRTVRDRHDYPRAAELLKEADSYSLIAHQAQTDLLTATANNEDINVDVLLVHSQDHLMTAMLAIDLIRELVECYKDIK
ncbi:MAG: PTS lactose/cellobiose transporter subunit IIA [Erysipelotrichia bacterium]|nr:PTS lactose/cellobiose transporter subunit IIA [Erysipelotrichia bacterium]